MLENKKPSIVISLVSGGIAGIVSKTIIAPIERVKFLFIVHPESFVDF